MKPITRPYEQGRISPEISRAEQMRRDNDNVKVPKITLYDIDYAIFYHIQQNVQPRIRENGVSIPVPVYFANGEKWAQIRSQGFMRDNSKKVLAPAIVIRRTTVTNDDRLPMPDMNVWNPSLYSPKLRMVPMRTMGMQWDRTSGQYQSKESLEYYVVDVPDFIRVNYELILWTDLMEQMNDLVHPLIGISDHVWGDFYKFRTNVQDVSHDNVNIPGEDRLVKSTVTLQVDGYLRAEYEYHQSKMQKQYSIKRVKFLSESTEQIFQETFGDLAVGDQKTTPLDVDPMEQQRPAKRDIRL